MKVNFSSANQSTILDAPSALRLNLVGPRQRFQDKTSLYAAINHTCTLSGARRLRASLLEPPNDLNTISSRQAAVAELVSKPQLLFETQAFLSKFPPIDSLLSMCVKLSDSQQRSVTIGSAADTRSRERDGIDMDINLTPSSEIQSNEATTASHRCSSSNIQKTIQVGQTENSSVNRWKTPNETSMSSSGSRLIERDAEIRLSKLIGIKHMLDLVKPLHDALRGSTSAPLKTYKEILSNNGYNDLLEKLTSVLRKDVCISKGALQMRVQKCFAIKTGKNILLDLTRRAYAEQVEDISRLVNSLGKEYNLPLRVAYNKARGFFIQVTDNSVELPKKAHRKFMLKNYYGSECEDPDPDYSNSEMVSDIAGRVSQNSFDSNTFQSMRKRVLPKVFIKVQKFRGIINCTTSELIKLNERVKGSLNEVYLIADSIVCNLIRELHPEMSLFYRLSETVTELDLICSLAKVVVGARPGHVFVKPVFGDTLAIQSGRHPIMDALSDIMPVSNHTFASNCQSCTIILGPSMSGKSTYLCQVAQIQIMAQIGSFVPAKFAAIRLADKIFVRMGSRDDMFTNASTFMLEMREVGHIIRSATETSLVLIDDFGLCTTDEDCFALSCAVCDHLSQTRTFTFFATADEALGQLRFQHDNIEICHFSVDIGGEKRPYKGLGSLVLPQRARITHPSPTNLQSSFANSSFDQSHLNISADSCSALSTQSNASYQSVPHVRYTYKLKKGVGPRSTCMLQLLRRFALNPQLLESIEKYYNILCQEGNAPMPQKPLLVSMEVDSRIPSMNEQEERRRHAHTTDIAASAVPYCLSPTNDVSMDAEPYQNISLTNGIPEKLTEGRPISALESSVLNAERPISDCRSESGPLMDRISHQIIQQIQMVACVLNTIETHLKENPNDTEVRKKAEKARGAALAVLESIKERYRNVIALMIED
uniref:DNA mismatch repair proteins mutS family domain-containing protein n=3 Tax=Schistocephalus solidus TaxID=70667 RepID=A0A0X3PFA2_SCHSO